MSEDSRVHLVGRSGRSHCPSRCSARRSRRSLFWASTGSAWEVFRKKPYLLRAGANLIRAASLLRCDSVPEWKRFPHYGPTDDPERERAIQPMEKTIRRQRLPNTDSIEELAKFWDSHDLTDFEEDLEEVSEPVFARTKGTSLRIELQPTEAQCLKKIARSKGIKDTTLLRQWILERLHESSSTGRPPNKALQPTAGKTRRG